MAEEVSARLGDNWGQLPIKSTMFKGDSVEGDPALKIVTCMRAKSGDSPAPKPFQPGTVGLLKNPIPGKMAIENKRVSMAIFAQMVLFQQPHSPRFSLPVPGLSS